MRLFLDTEFTGLTQRADLISLALVAPDGAYFYSEFTDYDAEQLTDWHRENVLTHLVLPHQANTLPPNGVQTKGAKKEVLAKLIPWLAQWEQIEIWADVPAYDWILFCELFGGALNIPQNIHYIVRDLATLLVVRGYDVDTDRFTLAFGKDGAPADLPRHNALADAWAGIEILQKIYNE